LFEEGRTINNSVVVYSGSVERE